MNPHSRHRPVVRQAHRGQLLRIRGLTATHTPAARRTYLIVSYSWRYPPKMTRDHEAGWIVYLRSSRRASALVHLVGPVGEPQRADVGHIWASGKSCDTPAPPCTWIALSRIHSTVAGVAILIAWISVCAPCCRRCPSAMRSSARAAAAARSAPGPRRSSPGPRPAPRWACRRRSGSAFARHISSTARSAIPIDRMQWWIRPGPSRACAMAKPSPSSPIRFAAGTRTLAKMTSAWPPWSRRCSRTPSCRA